MLRSASRLLSVVCAGAASVACLAALGAPAASASIDPCTAGFTPTVAMTSSNQPACWHPFTSTSPVNTVLPSNPALTANSSAIAAHMAQYGWYFGDSTSGFTFRESDGTRPLYFGQPSDPTYTIKCTYEEGPGTCQGSNRVNINGAVVHVPAGAQPGQNWDAHMIIVQSATGAEYDLWHTSISGNTITAGNGSEQSANTSDGTGGAGDAGDLALAAGLLRPSELASGHIDHALVIDIPCTDATGPNVGYSWPASGGWGEACGDYWNESTSGAPGMGQLFKLNLTPAQIAASGAPAWEQTIMTALATYGAYAEDTNGSWQSEEITIFSQDPISDTSVGQPDAWSAAINQLGGHNGTLQSNVAIPVSDLVAVNPCVPEGTCPNLQGPGTPSTGTTSGSSSGSTSTNSAPSGTSTTSTTPSATGAGTAASGSGAASAPATGTGTGVTTTGVTTTLTTLHHRHPRHSSRARRRLRQARLRSGGRRARGAVGQHPATR